MKQVREKASIFVLDDFTYRRFKCDLHMPKIVSLSILWQDCKLKHSFSRANKMSWIGVHHDVKRIWPNAAMELNWLDLACTISTKVQEKKEKMVGPRPMTILWPFSDRPLAFR